MDNPPQVEIAIVAALEREVAGIARGRQFEELPVSGSVLKVYRIDNAVLTCAGTGAARANLAARKLLQQYSPKLLISIGFTGSCTNKIAPGEIVVPAKVIENATTRDFATICGQNTLVTLDRVAGSRLKQCSAARFDAQVVDMEAAGVASAAAGAVELTGRKCDFAAIKAVSDGPGEEMDFLAQFITPEGFATARFVAHIAIRPHLWKKVKQLKQNSQLAANALEVAVREAVTDWPAFAKKHTLAK
jgi:nucleoside phosphorylase